MPPRQANINALLFAILNCCSEHNRAALTLSCRDSSVEAARQFQRISKAADLLLHRVSAGRGVPCSCCAHVEMGYNSPLGDFLSRAKRMTLRELRRRPLQGSSGDRISATMSRAGPCWSGEACRCVLMQPLLLFPNIVPSLHAGRLASLSFSAQPV